MAFAEQVKATEPSWFASERLEHQLKDYVSISLKLIWQRQAIFLAATLLAAFYFDASKALLCYGSVLFTEVLDLLLARRIRNWVDRDWAVGRNLLIWTMANTVLSASAISMFVVVIALQEGPGGHFTPAVFSVRCRSVCCHEQSSVVAGAFVAAVHLQCDFPAHCPG